MKAIALFCFSIFLAACGPTYRDVTPQAAGWRAPNLSASDQWGRDVALQSATSGAWAIVFFYPEADTPG
jgi:hypothetical protein